MNTKNEHIISCNGLYCLLNLISVSYTAVCHFWCPYMIPGDLGLGRWLHFQWGEVQFFVMVLYVMGARSLVGGLVKWLEDFMLIFRVLLSIVPYYGIRRDGTALHLSLYGRLTPLKRDLWLVSWIYVGKSCFGNDWSLFSSSLQIKLSSWNSGALCSVTKFIYFDLNKYVFHPLNLCVFVLMRN